MADEQLYLLTNIGIKTILDLFHESPAAVPVKVEST